MRTQRQKVCVWWVKGHELRVERTGALKAAAIVKEANTMKE